jgi:pimeloyl-ACP methyl ester carboxylesterase
MKVDNVSAPPEVPDEALADLNDRLKRFHPIDLPLAFQSGFGVDQGWLNRLLRRWKDGYDWRSHEERIRSLPWERVDGQTPLRVVHQRAGAGAPVVLLLHGWPDSVLRFEKVLPLLSEYTVVVPALPGYPFSVPSDQGGMSAVEMADVIAEAMKTLGYERYVISGGDIGSDIAEAMMRRHGESISAAHLTDVSQVHLAGVLPQDLTAEEQGYVERRQKWQDSEGGYSHEHSTKPVTLAVGLGDSPAGLLAWISEKLWSWTDRGDDITAVFSEDEVLTWVSAYWFTGAIGTSFGPYALQVPPSNDRIAARIPTVLSVFPSDLVNAPRSFAERLFDVRGFNEHDGGGHFAAWERPHQYVADLEQTIALDESDPRQ